MATPSPTGDYITLENVKVWFNPKQPGVIHLAADDPDIFSPDTGPGLRIQTNHNRKSADYNPGNFNRLRQALMLHGKSAPEEEAEAGSRKLTERHPRFDAQRTYGVPHPDDDPSSELLP